MRPSQRILIAFLVGASLMHSAAASAGEADDLFDQGLAAYKQGKLDEALSAYQSAWKLRKTQDLAAAMAQVEMLLGKHRDAAEHLSYALRYFPVSGKKELRDTLEKAFAEARTKVGEVHLRVSGDAPAPVITVDGAAVDVAVVAGDLFVAPGKRTIEASAKGYQTARQVLDVKEGQATDVTLSLVPEQQPVERSMVAPGIAFAVGGAGLIMGAIGGGIAMAKFGDIKQACGEDLVCPPGVRGQADAANTAAGVSTAGFVIAGVGAAVGVTLLLLPAKNKTSARVGLALSPSFIGVKGAF